MARKKCETLTQPRVVEAKAVDVCEHDDGRPGGAAARGRRHVGLHRPVAAKPRDDLAGLRGRVRVLRMRAARARSGGSVVGGGVRGGRRCVCDGASMWAEAARLRWLRQAEMNVVAPARTCVPACTTPRPCALQYALSAALIAARARRDCTGTNSTTSATAGKQNWVRILRARSGSYTAEFALIIGGYVSWRGLTLNGWRRRNTRRCERAVPPRHRAPQRGM
jgi:hypothetical protein